MLFSDQSLKLPSKDKDGQAATIGFLIDYLGREVIKKELSARKEDFILDNHLYVSRCTNICIAGA